MSYITKALRKLQNEKMTRYVAYDHIVSASEKSSKPSKKRLLIIGITIVFFFVAIMIVFLHDNKDKKVPPGQRISALPVAPTVHKELKPNKKADSRQIKTAVKVRTPQEAAEIKSLYAQALQRQREGKLEEAKILYEKVVKMDPYNVQAFNNLGVIYMGEKNYTAAMLRFNYALDVKHDYSDAHYNLACVLAKKNDLPRSLSYLKKAIQLNPEVRQWAKNDGDLDALRHLSEFKKLVEKQ